MYAQGWIYAGYRMTVFSVSEERAAEDSLLHGKLYFTMPDALLLARSISKHRCCGTPRPM